MELSTYSPDSKIWLYQTDRLLNATEKIWLQEQIDIFTQNWASHGTQLKATGTIYNDFTLILAVDTSHANSSGCSIDKSVHFIKEVGKQLEIDFFNRLYVWIKNEKGEFLRIPFKAFSQFPDAIYYNPAIHTIKELNSNFEIPIGTMTKTV